MTTTTTSLFPEIAGFITTLKLDAVSPERREILDPLAGFIQSKVSEDQEIRLNFICTHNSRRSHLSQIWAQAMAFHFNIKNSVP